VLDRDLSYKNPYILWFVYRQLELCSIKLNTSKFQTPIFHYTGREWYYELIPELSHQIELGQKLCFEVFIDGFYIQTKGMIRWIPNETGQRTLINGKCCK
jgi:iron complex outermembrane receptor protein